MVAPGAAQDSVSGSRLSAEPQKGFVGFAPPATVVDTTLSENGTSESMMSFSVQ